MMKQLHKQVGFTLVELIASIGVLALIAVIAVPIVDRVMFDAEEDADEISVAMIENAASMADATGDFGPVIPVKELAAKGYIETSKLESTEYINGFAVAQKDGYHKYVPFVNRNLVKKSDEYYNTSAYLVARYDLTDAWIPGETYTMTIKGDLSKGGVFGAWRDVGTTMLGSLRYDPERDVHIVTAVAKPSSRAGDTGKILSIYNIITAANREFGEIEWVKLERGSVSTPWIPADGEDFK